MHIEEVVIEELGLKILKKWNISIPRVRLKKTFLRSEPSNILKKRKLYIRGLTNKGLTKEAKEILGSIFKANQVIC